MFLLRMFKIGEVRTLKKLKNSIHTYKAEGFGLKIRLTIYKTCSQNNKMYEANFNLTELKAT